MATERDRPFSQFNFLVSWSPSQKAQKRAGLEIADGTLEEGSVMAGFQEVTGLGMEITVAEYRAGNASTNEPIKITGTVKTPDVTLKRGVIGRLDLFGWLDEVRNGGQNQLKDVTIKLLGEDRNTEAPAVVWNVIGARPMKYTGPSLNGKGTDLAIEELVLAAERIEME